MFCCCCCCFFKLWRRILNGCHVHTRYVTKCLVPGLPGNQTPAECCRVFSCCTCTSFVVTRVAMRGSLCRFGIARCRSMFVRIGNHHGSCTATVPVCAWMRIHFSGYTFLPSSALSAAGCRLLLLGRQSGRKQACVEL